MKAKTASQCSERRFGAWDPLVTSGCGGLASEPSELDLDKIKDAVLIGALIFLSYPEVALTVL
jgi:hypothetical protein